MASNNGAGLSADFRTLADRYARGHVPRGSQIGGPRTQSASAGIIWSHEPVGAIGQDDRAAGDPAQALAAVVCSVMAGCSSGARMVAGAVVRLHRSHWTHVVLLGFTVTAILWRLL